MMIAFFASLYLLQCIAGDLTHMLLSFVSGVKLLLKMGWRRGHSIKDVRAGSGLNFFNIHRSINFICALLFVLLILLYS